MDNMNEENKPERNHSSSESDVECSFEELGKRIVYIRNSLIGAKRPEFAKLIGVSISTQRLYETGARQPKASYLQKISVMSGVSMSWIATGEGEMRPQSEKPALHAHHVAEERPDYRAATPGQSLREARLTLERAEATIGYTPTIAWRETIKTLMCVHGLDEAGVERLVDLLKQENEEREYK